MEGSRRDELGGSEPKRIFGNLITGLESEMMMGMIIEKSGCINFSVRSLRCSFWVIFTSTLGERKTDASEVPRKRVLI